MAEKMDTFSLTRLHPASLHIAPSLYPALTLRDMGNINEKNASTDEEKEARRSLLEPTKHLDPWTDETEERAVETALLHDIEAHQSSSPAPERFQQGFSSGRDASSYELVAVRDENFDLPGKENEPGEETGNVSLPLSESIIPETFEAIGTTVSLSFTSKMDVSMPLTGDIRSLDAVEEFTEHTALLNFGGHASRESLFPQSPEPFNEFQTGRVGKISETTTLRSIASDRAAAITEQVLEKSPTSLASNSLLITPHQINDIPTVPLPPSSMANPLGESIAVLSPLVLGLSTLVDIGDMELSCQSETESCKNNELPLLMEVPPKELINFEDTALDNAENPASPHVAPFAPRHETVPLPQLSTEDSTNLFVSEIPYPEPSGLGLVVTTPTEPVSSMIHFSPASLYVSDGATESNQTPIKAPLPSIASLGSASEASEALASQLEAQLSIQASAVEDETELLQATISILNLDGSDTDIALSPYQAAQDVDLPSQSSQEAQAVTPEANSQASSLAIPEIRTYADATDIAMKYPELAKIVLQAPLASQRSAATIGQYSHKVEDGGDAEQDKPYLAMASREKDINLISAPSCGSVRSCIHTPDTPNWAIAPVLDAISPLKSSKSQRGRGRRRGKKTRMSQGNGSSVDDSQLISGPLKSWKATYPVSPKEESFQSAPPHDQFTSSEMLRKITLTNRQKVNKWISESASVRGPPKSSADQGPHAMASCSAFLMDSGLECVSDGLLSMDEDESPKKINLAPALRVAEALIAQENSEKSLNDSVLIEDDDGEKRTPSSILTTIANALVKSRSSSEEDWKVNLLKGKSFSLRSPTLLARRSRSASIASSLASGVSMKSGVSASSRLFQRAIEGIGSKNGALPIYGVPDGATCHTLLERQRIEPRATFDAVAQAPNSPSRKSALLDSSMPINAVTGTEGKITRDSTTRSAAPRAKGTTEAVTSSYHMVESSKHVGSNDERFSFTFEPPQASVGKDDQNTSTGSQNYVSPLFKTPVEGSVVQAPGSHKGGKTPRPPSSKTFIPTGKYVPPSIRDNEMFLHEQASATIRAKEATTSNGAPIQQTKVPRPSWPCMDVNAATIVTPTSEMNVYAPRFRSSDDVSVANPNQIRNDVMPDVRMHLETGNGPPAGVQRIFQDKSTIIGHYGESNWGSLASIPHTVATAHVNHSDSGVRSRGAKTPLDLSEIDPKQGLSDSQVRTDALVSQQQWNEYLAKLFLAQKRIQANMDDIVTSCYGEAETFDPIAMTSKNRNLEQASKASLNPVALKTTRSSPHQPSTSINFQNRFQTQASARHPTQNIPPRFQTQPPSQIMNLDTFEEFCKRQRQQTRTVNENMPSRLPRRKI